MENIKRIFPSAEICKFFSRLKGNFLTGIICIYSFRSSEFEYLYRNQNIARFIEKKKKSLFYKHFFYVFVKWTYLENTLVSRRPN